MNFDLPCDNCVGGGNEKGRFVCKKVKESLSKFSTRKTEQTQVMKGCWADTTSSKAPLYRWFYSYDFFFLLLKNQLCFSCDKSNFMINWHKAAAMGKPFSMWNHVKTVFCSGQNRVIFFVEACQEPEEILSMNISESAGDGCVTYCWCCLQQAGLWWF